MNTFSFEAAGMLSAVIGLIAGAGTTVGGAGE